MRGGRRLVPRWAHLVAALMVAAGTLFSAFWILSANSWMQTPVGYEVIDRRFFPQDWLKIIFNPSFPYRLMHTIVAFYITTAFVVVGVAAVDKVGNVGELSQNACVTPEQSTDFMEFYKGMGGRADGGFCAVSPSAFGTAHGNTPRTVAGLLAAFAVAFALRRQNGLAPRRLAWLSRGHARRRHDS